MEKLRLGAALTGSYCSFDKTLDALEELAGDFDIVPVMSEKAFNEDSRFGKAADFIHRLEELSGRKIISTIQQAEPFGPQHLADVLLIAPCTGNTLARLSCGINDTAVTMAAKSHLRNGGPVLIAVSTNDGLSASAENIGRLLNRKNIYFVPFYQDDPVNKPRSLVADLSRLRQAVIEASQGRQLQPIISGCNTAG